MSSQISDAELNKLIASDPEIQQVIQSVWGTTPANQRPGDTPKNLEGANDRASKQIADILQRKGIQLPKHTFINPRSASVEHMRGWAGLPTAAKVAIIAGVAATGIGTAGALGAFGGAAAVPSVGATGGLSAGAFPTITGTSGLAAGGAGATGAAGTLASTGLASSAALPFAGGAGNMAAGGTMAGLLGSGGGTAAGAAGSAAKSGGFLSSLMKPKTLETIGTGLGSIGKTAANNRGVQLDAMMEADKMGLAANQSRRADESDLWRKIQAANYIKGGGMPERKPMMSSSGAEIPSFAKLFGPPPITQADKDMADTLLPQLQSRLANPPVSRDYDSLMKSGKTETAMNWLGPLVSGYGAFRGNK